MNCRGKEQVAEWEEGNWEIEEELKALYKEEVGGE